MYTHCVGIIIVLVQMRFTHAREIQIGFNKMPVAYSEDLGQCGL